MRNGKRKKEVSVIKNYEFVYNQYYHVVKWARSNLIRRNSVLKKRISRFVMIYVSLCLLKLFNPIHHGFSWFM